MKITLQADKCLSCGMCAQTAPTVFSLDTGIVKLIKDDATLTPEEQTQAKQAASFCPNDVIGIEE